MTRTRVAAALALVAAADAACFPHDTQTGEKCIFAIDADSFAGSMFSCLSACQARGLSGSLLVPESAQDDAAAHAACEAADYAFCQVGLAEAAFDEDGVFGFADDGEWATFPSLGVATALGCARRVSGAARGGISLSRARTRRRATARATRARAARGKREGKGEAGIRRAHM